MKTRSKLRGICLLIILFLVLSNINLLYVNNGTGTAETIDNMEHQENQGSSVLSKDRGNFRANYSSSLLPTYQKGYGVPGTTVDHILNLENIGTKNDTYNLTVSNNSWTVVFRDIGDNNDITNISVESGNKSDLIRKGEHLQFSEYG